MKRLLLIGLLPLLAGCLTVTTKDGTRVHATGNARVVVKGDGSITVENKDTAESYEAIGKLIGVAAGEAAKTAAKP